MIQIELYIKEITRFLRTMTLKNDYFKDQMEETYGADAFKGHYPDHLHPYYRHLLGKPSYASLSEFRKIAEIPDTVTDGEIAVTYGFDYVKIPDERSPDERKKEITYTTINGLNIMLTSYPVKINSDGEIDNENGDPYKVYPNCVYYYGDICPVRALYSRFDELMVVNSLDTSDREVVPFNSHLFTSNRYKKTASMYRMPNRYYTKLCANYPRNVDLIKAIVYPVPSLAACVDAKNYSIISCDLTQLRENERASMYNCLLNTLSMIRVRWDVPDFVYEDLYALDIQAKIWNVLLLALMNQRVKNIRTSAAHEYHVWEYLKSHGVGDYSDVLSLNQTIYLYRNFPYFLRSRGSDFNLILLSHKLLSEWNITLFGKNVLQTTPINTSDTDIKFTEVCRTSPCIDSVVVGKNTLAELRRIDRNDENYLNKTMKFSDELSSFDYQSNDIQQNQSGSLETLKSIYKKEQNVGIEYQNTYLFDHSTEKQTSYFTNTPHTTFTTKLLEIAKEPVSEVLKQVYARFVTETLLYRVAIGQADYYISVVPDESQYAINLSIRDAIGMVWFCALKELGLYDKNCAIYPYVYLTVPYKSQFSSIQNTYRWANKTHSTKNILHIIPSVFTLKSDNLPVEFCGDYTLTNASDSRENWVWTNANSAVIKFDVADSLNRWSLKWSAQSGQPIELTADYKLSYNDWEYQELVWKMNGETYESQLILKSFEYLMDRFMPNGIPDSHVDLANLIHEQALGYVQIYKELHGSDWSRQHTGVTDIVQSRTVNEVVRIDFFDGETFEEFISSNTDLKDAIEKIEGNATPIARSEYAKLGNRILQAIFPVKSEYLDDNSGVSVGRFTRLKELLVSLCSYNITYIEDSAVLSESSLALTSFVTQDYDFGKSSFSSKYFIDTASLSVYYGQRIDDRVSPICINSTITDIPPVSTGDGPTTIDTIGIIKKFRIVSCYPDSIKTKTKHLRVATKG